MTFNYRITALLIMTIGFMAFESQYNHIPLVDLTAQQWIHGSKNCQVNVDEKIQIIQYDETTWIFRQNKCTHYEAPFMFLFLGDQKALLIDTGATQDPSLFPLEESVSKIINQWQEKIGHPVKLIVAHTHSHGDHFAGDSQFRERSDIEIVGLTTRNVENYFQITDWPNQTVNYSLGKRELTIIPIPGHQVASLAFYDPVTKILLTGDTFYPGRLYVENWNDFKNSIKRLVVFTEKHEISYILGNHIEMANSGQDYPVGTTFQPDEHILPLSVKDLQHLDNSLDELGDQITRKNLGKFIVFPVN